MNITIGADPEFFVQRYRHFISPHHFPFGTKAEPLATPNGAVQVDGLALEINIRPASNRTDFVKNMIACKSDLSALLYDYEPRAKIVARPSVFFGRSRLAQLPETATTLGCQPDYNAYTEQHNPTPNGSLPFRTGAGHLHIGWTSDVDVRRREHLKICCALAKELDYVIGLPSLVWDKDKRRRELYGQAGAFRPKPYGMEYRVLSNAWCTTEKHIGWVFDKTHAAAHRILTHADERRYADRYGTLAAQYINHSDNDWQRIYSVLAEELLR